MLKSLRLQECHAIDSRAGLSGEASPVRLLRWNGAGLCFIHLWLRR